MKKAHNINGIANQIIITEENGTKFFQSYNSIICKIENGVVTLDPYYWDYSKTTGRYRNIFLNETKMETQAKIDAGIYKLENLN